MRNEKLTFLLLVAVQLIHVSFFIPSLYISTETRILMGSRFSFTAVAESEQLAQKAVSLGIEEVVRIEKLISSWDDSSQTAEINRLAGRKPSLVSNEFYGLVQRSTKVSRLTEGAFDITFAGIDKLWKFDGSMQALPDSHKVRESIKYISWEKIILQNSGDDEPRMLVGLQDSNMRIGFGGIGKGYAADRAKAIMKHAGAHSGIVNAGGDLCAWGEEPEGGPWKLAIANPVNPDEPIGFLELSDMAVVTSGNYERYAEIDGLRYAHIIDPRTGWPARGLVSVTVVCPSAELADALATAVFVMGKEKGLDLINQLEGIECLVIDEEGEWFATEPMEIR
jgi:thiamine biosynthesis lipoprotein